MSQGIFMIEEMLSIQFCMPCNYKEITNLGLKLIKIKSLSI